MNSCTDDSLALELFNSNTRLAYKIANHYKARNGRIELDDMCQVALMALWQAALKFDPKSGNKFSTIATHYCNGRCLTYIRDKSDLVRKPPSKFWSMPGQIRVVAKLNDLDGEHPTDVMLDKLTKHETSTPLDLLLEIEEDAVNLKLLDCLDSLPWEQAYVLRRRYRDEMRVEDVAAELRITTEEIKILAKAGITTLNSKRPVVKPKIPKQKVETKKKEKCIAKTLGVREFKRLKAEAKQKKEAKRRELLSLKGTMTQRKAAALFGVCQYTVASLWSGKHHKNLQEKEPTPQRTAPGSCITPDSLTCPIA